MSAIEDPVLTSVSRTIAALADRARPVVVALDGPVAAGKSTLAAGLVGTLRNLGLAAAQVAADGFLLPLARLEGLGLVGGKGFPESFDRPAMLAFLAALRAGEAPDAPAYDHQLYDVSVQQHQPTRGAAVVIVEGVNVLQPDLCPQYDLRLYLDTPEEEAKARFLRRFAATPFSPARAQALAPWRPADGDPASWGEAVWAAINGPNLERHIASGRTRADRILAG